jgi:transcriptional regulator with XRE-family HTH domain
VTKKRIHVPKELPAYLERTGLSQQQFAEKLKVSQGLVWQWLNGETAISPDKARAIEALTGIPRIRLLYPEERAA